MTDKFDLGRFVTAQQATFDTALAELNSGLKRTHWMWFVFPQLEGLAVSETARRYSIKSVEEARKYLEHPVLGPRLKRCAQALLGIEGKSANDIFSCPDDVKLRSSMTLFSFLAGKDSVFQSVLDKYFGGEPDDRTIDILNRLGAIRQPINTNPRITESSPFKVFAARVGKQGKSKCGDSFAVAYSEDEEVLLLAVADGVSSSPCDWKASETACEAIVERFKSAAGTIAQRMADAASKAHNAVRQLDGRCAGSITSLTFVVWSVPSDEIHVLNVGDSRVYLGPDNAIEQITSDDVQPVLLKRNGEVVLQAGVPVFMRGVTRSLGQIDSLEFSVHTHEFKDNHLLVLVSDGISKNEIFTSDLPSIFNRTDVDQHLSTLIADNSQRNKDDATLIAVWRKPANNEETSQRYEDCVKRSADFRNAGLSPSQVLDLLQADLLDQIQHERNDKVNATLDYADQYGIRFHRDFLSDFLSLVIRQGTDKKLVARLRDLIRKSH